MSELIEKLRQRWLDQGLTLGHGASEPKLMQFEARYGVVLPTDFRHYLTALNGLPHLTSDNNFISFWPLSQIRSLAEEYPDSTEPDANLTFLFADWSIRCQEYVIRLSADPNASTPIFVTHTPLLPIASSFPEFLERYLGEDHNLLWPQLSASA